MNKIKSFIIADVVVLIIKVLGGLLTNSITMIASGIYDIALIIVTLVTVKAKKENKNYQGIVSSIIGIIIILLGLLIIFLSFVTYEIKGRTSLFVIFFLLLAIIIRYVVSCFNTNLSYQKKEGLLTIGRVKSNIDFLTYAVIVICLILSKVSKYWSILKIADNIGTILIASLIIIKGIKIIVSSINYLEEKKDKVSEEYKEEITKRDEIKKLSSLEIKSYGGIKAIDCNIILKDNISMIDTNTFVLTLQDYLLKIADVANISLVKMNKVGTSRPTGRQMGKNSKTTTKDSTKKINIKENNASTTTKKNIKERTSSVTQKNNTTTSKGRSLKEDARNSRSRNSKTNSKKKNTKKKNKKR